MPLVAERRSVAAGAEVGAREWTFVAVEGPGLGQYVDAFAADHIDGRLPRGLTGDDLREMVLPT
jgi:hypothetical protein